MWRQWSLGLLYLLQVVVLSGMLAGYILNVPAPSSHTEQQATLFEQTSSEQRKSKVSQVKPSVKMKPITLSYLKENLARVSSPLELARLFIDSDLDDHQLSQWMSRTVRSAIHSTNHRFRRELETFPEHNGKEDRGIAEINEHDYDSAKEQEKWEIDTRGNPQNKDSVSTEDEAGSIEETEYVDEEFDYTQDESTKDELEAFEAALHHIEEINTCSSTRCKHPMPFVQSVRDPHDKARMFLPECVVLHRCMNYTGCCGGGNLECVPKSMNIITKAFLIVDRHASQDDQLVFSPSMATTITFVNHTECECREKPKLLKCTQLCPKPFRLTQEGTRCRCDCFSVAYHDSWPCESVKDGVVPLSHDGQTCIKSGNCYHPDCTVGDFDIKSGLCPLSDEYALPAFLFGNPDDRHLYREHLQNYDFSNSHTKHTGSGNDLLKHSTPSDHYGFHRDTTTDTKEQEVNLQRASLLGSDAVSTVKMPVKDSKFTSIVTTKSSIITHDNQNIYKHSAAFSSDKAQLVKSASRTTSDKPAHELEDMKGFPVGNVPATNINEHKDNRTGMNLRLSPNNITSRHNKSNYVNLFNETVDINKDTVHKPSEEEMSEEVIDSEDMSRDMESPPFVPENTASDSSWHSESQFDSSLGNNMNEEHAPSRKGDHLTRRNARTNILRHKSQLGLHRLHEDVHSTGAASQSQRVYGTHADKNSPKNLPQPTTVSSTPYSLASSPFPKSQISSSSSKTSSYLPSSLPHPVHRRQKASKQPASRDYKHSKTSNDKFQLEGLSDYDYDTFDSSGEELQQDNRLM